MPPLFLLTLTLLTTLVTAASPPNAPDDMNNKPEVTEPSEVNAIDVNREKVVRESLYIVTGTITKVTIGDTSKTSRVKRLVMHLFLKTPDSPNEELMFIKRPVLESDMRLSVGQTVSIVALKNILCNYDYIDCIQLDASDIVYIAPPNEPLFITTGTITQKTYTNMGKTIFKKKAVINLHLKTPDSPKEDLKFTGDAHFEYGKGLSVGQTISIAARRNESSEYSDIVYLFTGE